MFAPSILADSNIVLSMDFRLVRISSVENGIHVQDNITIMDPKGYSFKKSIPSKFSKFNMNVPKPLMGSIIRFFQGNAETLGITRKGDMYSNLTKFDKNISAFNREANINTREIVIISNENTIIKVLRIAS